MEAHKWKLGDRCYIVYTRLMYGFVCINVMPARISHVEAGGLKVKATSHSTHTFGPITMEGNPFISEDEAQTWIKKYVEQIRVAGETASLTGKEPQWEIADDTPTIGDIIYAIVPNKKQLIEVVVGVVTMKSGRPELAYEPVPGTNKVPCVYMGPWWKTREAAEAFVKEKYGEPFTFLPKEEIARRAQMDNLARSALTD